MSSWAAISAAALVLTMSVMGITVAGDTVGATPALAAATATAPPSPTPDPPVPTSTEETAVAATTVATDPADFTATGFVAVSGTKLADSAVAVTVGSPATRLCSVAADTRTTWTCSGLQLLPNGADVRLTATESVPTGDIPATATTLVDVLGAPLLDGNPTYITTGVVSGQGFPGSAVAVVIDGTTDARCGAVPIDGQGFWSCNVAQSSGGPFTVRAQQSNSAIGDGRTSAFSDVRTVTIDRDAPLAAVITAPATGTRVVDDPLVVAGSGENGANIDVYLDNVPKCSTVVSSGTWSCAIGGIDDGARSITAIQRDAAGNFGPASAVVKITIGAAATTAPGTPTPTPTAPRPEPIPTPVPVPEPSAEAPVVPPEETTGPPNTDWSLPVPGEALTNWGTPTGFGSNLAGFTRGEDRAGWYTSLVLAVLFLVLVAFPLRLLVSALHGRLRRPAANIWGRNRRDVTVPVTEVPRPVNAWLAAAVPLAAAAGLIVFSGGINGEVRYVRLLLAVGLGLVLLNIVGAALATRVGSMWSGTHSRLRFLPLMLLASVVAVIVARSTGVEPPLLVGVLAGAVFAVATPVRRRAAVNLVQVGVVLAIAVLAWGAHGLLGAVDGFWPSVASETLATLCLAGLGSALVLVLPIATLPGRVILEWSTPAWVATVLVVAIVVASIVYGTVSAGLALIPLIVTAAVFAALSLATWTFVRFVEPPVGV